MRVSQQYKGTPSLSIYIYLSQELTQSLLLTRPTAQNHITCISYREPIASAVRHMVKHSLDRLYVVDKNQNPHWVLTACGLARLLMLPPSPVLTETYVKSTSAQLPNCPAATASLRSSRDQAPTTPALSLLAAPVPFSSPLDVSP
ncbi:unnamed protein product [Chrysoparadoxa australica]